MEVIDKRALKKYPRYLKQCLLATAVIVAVIYSLDVVSHTVIIATLGATTFIVFAMPHNYASSPRRIIGGYLVGIIVGLAVFYLNSSILNMGISTDYNFSVLLGGLAVGASTLLMAFTNTEHPPAAGLAMGLVFNTWTTDTLLVISGAVFFLALSKHLLGKWLINLYSTPKEQTGEVISSSSGNN